MYTGVLLYVNQCLNNNQELDATVPQTWETTQNGIGQSGGKQ